MMKTNRSSPALNAQFLSGMAQAGLPLLASIALHCSLVGAAMILLSQPQLSGQSAQTIGQAPLFVTLISKQKAAATPERLANQSTPQNVQPKALPPERQKLLKRTDKGQEALDQPAEKPAPNPPQKARLMSAVQVPSPTPQAKARAQQQQNFVGGTGFAPLRYQDQVRAVIESHRIYPRTARRRQEEGTALLTLQIARDGSILQSRFIRSSGHHLLDQAAVEMVKASAPLPEIPASLPAPLWLKIPIGFQLK